MERGASFYRVWDRIIDYYLLFKTICAAMAKDMGQMDIIGCNQSSNVITIRTKRLYSVEIMIIYCTQPNGILQIWINNYRDLDS